MKKYLFLSLILVLLMVPSIAYGEKLGIECNPDSPKKDQYYEAIFECHKELDVNKNVLETMFNDIRWISGIFDNAKLYDIKQNGSTGTATIEIPILPSITLKSEIEFYKTNSNYNVEFINGKLQDSKIIIKTSETYGFDESEGMGSLVDIDFKMKKILCFELLITQKCAKPNEIMYALDKGMYLMEPKAKLFQQQHPEYIKITSPSDKSQNDQTVIEDKTDPSKFVSQEEITQISTSNQVNQAKKEIEKTPTREYFKTPELPNPTSGRDSITLETDKTVFLFGSDVIITTEVQPIKNQPIKLDFYNSDNELSYSTSFSPSPDGINYKILNLGDEIPTRIGEDFTIFASYGDSKTSKKISLLRMGATIELDQPVYSAFSTVYVAVIAPELNLDPQKIEKIGSDENAKLTISTNKGLITNYELTETNHDTGIFFGELSLTGNDVRDGDLFSNFEDELQVLLELPYIDVVANTKINSPKSTSSTSTSNSNMVCNPNYPGICSTKGEIKLKVTPNSVNYDEDLVLEGISSFSNYAIHLFDENGNSYGLVKTSSDKSFKFIIPAQKIYDKIGASPKMYFSIDPNTYHETKVNFNFIIKKEMKPLDTNPSKPENSIQKQSKVPEWVKNNAKWWADGQVDDSTFTQGIGFLIKEKIIGIASLPEQSSGVAEQKVPDWIKNNAGWWADEMISEDDFIKGIKYLVESGIIKVD